MPRSPSPFRATELIRAMKAAEKARYVVKEAGIAPDGSIRLVFDTGAGNDNITALDKWEAENARSNAIERRSPR